MNGDKELFRIPHLIITRIYYRLVVENKPDFSRFPEAGVRGAMGYYLYDEIKKNRRPEKTLGLINLYKALLGTLPGTNIPPEGPMPRSINIRFFDIPDNSDHMGLEITFFGDSKELHPLLQESLQILGEEGIGRRANRFYFDGMRPPQPLDIATLPPLAANSATLVFYSPTSFRLNRQESRSWNLEMFCNNLLQRAQLLCNNYGECTEWPQEELLQQMLSIKSTARTDINNRFRLSSRQKKRINCSGFTGQVHLENISPDAGRILSIGAQIGVGKNTTFGGGRYTILCNF